jgi:hypothetical protein
MKKFLTASLILFLPFPAFSESVFLKDGKVHTTREIRRDGNFLLFKALGADGAQSDVVTPLNQIDRIDFGDPPSIAEARQLAKQGDSIGVIEKTTDAASFFRNYTDVPGNLWLEVMRLRLPAIAIAGNASQLAELQTQWTPTGDTELDTAFRLTVAKLNDPDGAHKAWNALAQPGASSLSAGISWLEIGNEALAAKQWNAAIRAFLSVEVFVTHQRLLQPKALLGAAKAFVLKGDKNKAAALVEEIKTEYPRAAAEAAAILK